MNRFFLSIVSLLVSLSMSGQLPFQKSEVKEVMKKVADWQIAHQKDVKHGPLDWTNAALYMGMLDWAELAEKESGDTSYYDWLVKLGRRYGWQPDKRMYHADDIAVGQVFVDLYCKYKDRNMLYPTQARAEWVVNHPSDGPMELDYKKRETLERWTWCDALYRDSRYLTQKEANGAKVFWGRGNGWVLGGLAEMLQDFPKKDKNRKFYEDLFVTLSERAAKLQSPDGFWHASMLDPASYPSPETSATGFIVYALAYGINEGLLDKDIYLPVVEKGWKALVSAVETDGKLGYVQPIGADPKKVTRDMTEVYGVGAFLLAGNQIYKLI